MIADKTILEDGFKKSCEGGQVFFVVLKNKPL